MDVAIESLTKYYQSVSTFVERVFFMPLVRKILDGTIYGVLPFVLIMLWIVPQLSTVTRFFAKQAGSLSQVLLLIILFMKPVGVVFGIRILKRTLVFRREMGVAMFYLALFHFAVLVTPSLIFDITYYRWSNHVLYGAVALIFAGMLWITSNNHSMRLLGRNWKRLHALAYPMLFLVLLHAAITSGEWTKILVLVPLYSALKVLEWRRVTIKLPIISQ